MTLATFLLQSAGYEVITATDAETGVSLARAQNPALILMDIQLPGMDGLQATAQLRADESTRAIPVVALTAREMKGDEERIRAAGCDGYIAKPLDYKSFLATVAGFCRDGEHFYVAVRLPPPFSPGFTMRLLIVTAALAIASSSLTAQQIPRAIYTDPPRDS